MTPEEIMLQVATYGLARYGLEGSKWTEAGPGQSWDGRHWEPLVKAQIEALDAAGWMIVPKEPTDEMLEAAVTDHMLWPREMLLPVSAAEDIWRTMIAAAQTQETRQSED